MLEGKPCLKLDNVNGGRETVTEVEEKVETDEPEADMRVRL